MCKNLQSSTYHFREYIYDYSPGYQSPLVFMFEVKFLMFLLLNFLIHYLI